MAKVYVIEIGGGDGADDSHWHQLVESHTTEESANAAIEQLKKDYGEIENILYTLQREWSKHFRLLSEAAKEVIDADESKTLGKVKADCTAIIRERAKELGATDEVLKFIRLDESVSVWGGIQSCPASPEYYDVICIDLVTK